MAEVKSASGILDVIKDITANRESGRLEIGSVDTHGSGLHGVLLFVEGKLVDARLESLSGFQAVNAAVALRDVEFSFDHVMPAPQPVCIAPSERVVLKRFFGIEVAETQEPVDLAETEAAWNETPEQVVPLAEVEELPQTDLEETPTVEIEALPVHSVPLLDTQVSGNARPSGEVRKFAFLLRPQVALGLVLLLGLVVGAVTLRARFKARQQATAVASAVASDSSPVAPAANVAAPDSNRVAPKSNPIARAANEVRPVPKQSPSVTVAPRPAAVVSQRQKAPVRSADVHDLNGEWRLINVIEKTDYKSFHNMQLGFRVKINQKGNEFTATGEKFLENGQTLPAGSRTPIQLTGTIEGDQVVATFIEDGRRRRSNGRFVWKLQSGGDRLTGTFVSTAANNSGRSAVTKEH